MPKFIHHHASDTYVVRIDGAGEITMKKLGPSSEVMSGEQSWEVQSPHCPLREATVVGNLNALIGAA